MFPVEIYMMPSGLPSELTPRLGPILEYWLMVLLLPKIERRLVVVIETDSLTDY